MTALPTILKRNIIANPCNQIFVCLYHMMLVVSFLYFSMKYMGSCPLNRKIIRDSRIAVQFYFYMLLQPRLLLISATLSPRILEVVLVIMIRTFCLFKEILEVSLVGLVNTVTLYTIVYKNIHFSCYFLSGQKNGQILWTFQIFPNCVI